MFKYLVLLVWCLFSFVFLPFFSSSKCLLAHVEPSWKDLLAINMTPRLFCIQLGCFLWIHGCNFEALCKTAALKTSDEAVNTDISGALSLPDFKWCPFSSGGFSPLINKHKSLSSWKCQSAAFTPSIMSSCWHFHKEGALLGGEWKWNRCRVRGVGFHPCSPPRETPNATQSQCPGTPRPLQMDAICPRTTNTRTHGNERARFTVCLPVCPSAVCCVWRSICSYNSWYQGQIKRLRRGEGPYKTFCSFP